MYRALASFREDHGLRKRVIFDLNHQGIIYCKASTINQKTDKYSLYVNDPKRPLLERLCFCYPEFLLDVLINNELATLLNFRLVSKELNVFASTQNVYYPCNPLFEKATVSFQYCELHPQIEKVVKEKLEFLQKTNLELQVISPSIFENLLNIQKALNVGKRIKIILKIDKEEDLNKIPLFSIQNDNIFFANVKVLDFSGLIIDNSNIQLFNAILANFSQHLDFLKSLKTIVIREVDSAVTLQLPEPLNSKKIIFILNEDKSWLTVENAAKGLVAGLGIYGLYRYFCPEETKKEEKK